MPGKRIIESVYECDIIILSYIFGELMLGISGFTTDNEFFKMSNWIVGSIK